MSISWCSRIPALLPLALVFSACSQSDRPASATGEEEPWTGSRFLYAWTADYSGREGSTDFLATFDADPTSPTYGSVLSRVPLGSSGTGTHHAERVAPSDGPLFANSFTVDRTFLFDLSEPSRPVHAGELEPVPGFEALHGLVRLPDGRVLATLQRSREERGSPGRPGALALFDAQGTLLQVSPAQVPDDPSSPVRPYDVEAFPDADRVVTTSYPMGHEPSPHLVQIWRLSDLSLLTTLPVPALEAREQPECTITDMFARRECDASRIASHEKPFAVRMLPDGSGLVQTFGCAFYRLSGIESERPTLDPVLVWPDRIGCAVPTLIGDIWIVPNQFTNELVTLDLSDPSDPVELDRVVFTAPFGPHYVQSDPLSNRIVVTGVGLHGFRILIYRVDVDSGELVLDARFNSPEASSEDIDPMELPAVFGPAIRPHAVLFGS